MCQYVNVIIIHNADLINHMLILIIIISYKAAQKSTSSGKVINGCYLYFIMKCKHSWYSHHQRILTLVNEVDFSFMFLYMTQVAGKMRCIVQMLVALRLDIV